MSRVSNKNLCKLCNAETAGKTGSHIIPHFILKYVDNEAGTKSRDKELGLKIGDSGVDAYFGRAILPESIEKILGDYQKEELNKSDLIVDHLFCKVCEDFFGRIESDYSLLNFNQIKSDAKIAETSFLFWLSIFWRVSLIKFGGFMLKGSHGILIQRILKSRRYSNVDGGVESQVGYRIIRCEKVPDEFPSGIFFHPFHTMPYMAVVGGYVLQLFVKKSHLTTVKRMFFGFEENFKNEKLSTIKTFHGLGVISSSAYNTGMNRLLYWLHDKQNLNWRYKLDNVFALLNLGKKMPESIKQEILYKLYNSELPIGRKYRTEEVSVIVYSVLIKYGLIK